MSRNQELLNTFSELYRKLQAQLGSTSTSATPSLTPSPLPSHITESHYPEDYTRSPAIFFGLCAIVLIGVPLLIVSIVKFGEYVQSTICTNRKAVHPLLDISPDKIVPEDNMIENLDLTGDHPSNHSAQV